MNGKTNRVFMRVHANGINIYYETAGKGQPVLLLHGNGEDHTIFDLLTEGLKTDHEVFALDTRGHGESEKIGSFHYSDMAEDVASFIKELKIKKPVVYGFSDGGIIGLMLASRYPDMLSGVVASGPNLTPKALKLSARLPMRIANVFKRDPLVEMMIKEPNMTDADLSKIKVPVLITVAEKDVIPISHAEHIADKIPNGSLIVVPYENHYSYIIHSDWLFPLISDFINEIIQSQ